MRLLAAIKARVAAGHARFHVPGHKGSQKHSEALRDLLSENTVLADLTELPGLDNLHSAEGAIADAQEAASAAFSASETHFLVNGSTGGMLAVVSACCGPNATLVTSRASHVSVFNAAAAAGCDVALIDPKIDSVFGVPLPLTADDVMEALGCVRQRVGAVLVTCPTYEGLCCDLQAIARVCHSRGIPLIVDEAHGAHLGLHPSFPPSAMQSGADFSVQSTHKTLGSLTQSAMLHVHAHAPPRATASLPRFLRMFQSSSPSYLLLCSLDAATDVARSGPHAWEHALRAATHVRHAWRASGGQLLSDVYTTASPNNSSNSTTRDCDYTEGNAALYATEQEGDRSSAHAMMGQHSFQEFRKHESEERAQIFTDPLRVTLLTTDHDMSGYQCAQKLERHGVAPEMATHACVVLALGIGSKLVDSVRAAEAFQKVLRTENSSSKMLDAQYSPKTPEATPAARNDTHEPHALREKVKQSRGNPGMHESRHAAKSKQKGPPKRKEAVNSSARDQNQGAKMTEIDSAAVALATPPNEIRPRSNTVSCNGACVVKVDPKMSTDTRVTVVRGIREAATGVVERMCWEEVLERGGVCGGLVSVYPPGVPVLVYGEEVTEAALEMLRDSVEAGGQLVGCSSDLSDIPVAVK